jgi:hypothetical protein
MAGAVARSRATPAAVFSLLKNSDTWPRWSLFNSSEVERAGNGDHFGVGAIRTFSTRVSKTTEQVAELIPDQKLSYVLLSGLCSAATKVRSRFWAKRFGPSRRRARSASAAVKILARQRKKTFFNSICHLQKLLATTYTRSLVRALERSISIEH